jgi:phosphate acetyltransferase
METVNPAVPSTIEAAALCKMAERGQTMGGILDGPLALDNAINEEAAAIKHIVSPVAGRTNVLVVPNLEAAASPPMIKTDENLMIARHARALVGG